MTTTRVHGPDFSTEEFRTPEAQAQLMLQVIQAVCKEQQCVVEQLSNTKLHRLQKHRDDLFCHSFELTKP